MYSTSLTIIKLRCQNHVSMYTSLLFLIQDKISNIRLQRQNNTNNTNFCKNNRKLKKKEEKTNIVFYISYHRLVQDTSRLLLYQARSFYFYLSYFLRHFKFFDTKISYY